MKKPKIIADHEARLKRPCTRREVEIVLQGTANLAARREWPHYVTEAAELRAYLGTLPS